MISTAAPPQVAVAFQFPVTLAIRAAAFTRDGAKSTKQITLRKIAERPVVQIFLSDLFMMLY